MKVDYDYSDDKVVVDGNIVTSQGPGTCFLFALKLVELLVDETTAKNIQDGLLLIKWKVHCVIYGPIHLLDIQHY